MTSEYLTRTDVAPLCAAVLDLGAVADAAADWPEDLWEQVALVQLKRIAAEVERLRQIYREKKGGSHAKD